MKYSSSQQMRWSSCTRFMILVGALVGSGACRADVLSAVQLLREGGCGGLLPAAAPLQRNALLDHAARDWAAHEQAAHEGAPREATGTAGMSPGAAASHGGYNARLTAGLHISGPDSRAIELLRRTSCRTIVDQDLHDIGIYSQGSDTWLLLAAAYPAPSRAEAPLRTARVLHLVNAVRASGTRCGGREFGPVPPVKLSTALTDVAYHHASDMAAHDYFEHEDLAGHTPADRVRAVGYREKLVGENIAYGPQSADEVVRGWLDSPGHCENIMDSRFAEMGVAFAAGQAAKRGLYWVQVLAAPQA